MNRIVLGFAFAALGVFANAQQTQKIKKMDPAKMEQKRANHLQKMKAELNLTDAQVAKIKDLQDSRIAERKLKAPQRQAERKAKREMMQAKRAKHNAEMQQILTAEQFKKYQEKQNDRKMQHKKMVKNHRMHSKIKAK